MNKMSIVELTIPAIIIHLIGATARSKLKVIIVGMIIIEVAKVLPKAPIPTAIPPKQPTIVRITQINPKRLNSESLNNFSNLLLCTCAFASISSIFIEQISFRM